MKHLAAISVEDAGLCALLLWDVSVIKNIESAISTSNLGVQPIADKQSIRISLPGLTEERRKALTKILSAKLEESKIPMRQERDKVWKDIQEKERAGEIPRISNFVSKTNFKKIVDKISADLEEMSKRKSRK